MPFTWIQVRDVLDEALQIPAEDRSRYLDGACPQPELRRYVDSLIISYEKANEFLERPAFDQRVDLPRETEPSGDWIGRRIGPYRIEQEIGHGGMGTVFRAVRADDEYHKQVAIKLVRGGFASNFALAQFKEERQILAGLEHPNIARLLDGGHTDAGFPYLVMELVEGAPIDEYCNARRLSISARLELFRTVCAAVQFAHQNLVIHRDLKPANILVSADGTPKLLDFGIAKLVSPETLSPAPEQTVSFLRMMTPEYASPEQVRGDPIGTATDVYSLGLVLYFLLCGHQPYQLTGSAPQALVDIICDTEPVKPSEIVSRTETIGDPGENGDLTITPESVSSARGTKPDRLRHCPLQQGLQSRATTYANAFGLLEGLRHSPHSLGDARALTVEAVAGNRDVFVRLTRSHHDYSRLTGHSEVGLFGVNLTGNALPFVVTYGVSSALSRRFADNPSNSITSEWPTMHPECAGVPFCGIPKVLPQNVARKGDIVDDVRAGDGSDV